MIDVKDHIEVRVVSDGKFTRGWCLTVGLQRFGLPELEIRGLPLFMADGACRLMNNFADYMINHMLPAGKDLTAGELVQLDSLTIVQVLADDPIPGEEKFYEWPRLRIVDAPGYTPCEACGKGERHVH